MTALTSWIDALKQRGCNITVNGDGPTIDGRHNNNDRTNLARHRHALVVAAAGTNLEWWRHIIGQPTRTLLLDDIPSSAADPDAFACACCGNPAAHLDMHMLPWCDLHWQGG